MTLAARGFDHQGIPVRYWTGGEGFPVLLIHGSGPGASTKGNWRTVLDALASRFNIFAVDLIGFGESGRKPAEPYFDLHLWIEQCRALIRLMPSGPIGIIGHSISGALALHLAARESRVSAVLTTGTLGAPLQLNRFLRETWTFPRDRASLRRTAEILIHDKGLITEAYLDGREAVLRSAAYEAYFSSMFREPKEAYLDATVIPSGTLDAIRCPVTLLHGRNDLAVPPTTSLALAERLPQADVTLLSNCSHSVALERPDALLTAADQLFKNRLSATAEPI